MTIKVLVVDDSTVIRRILTQSINADPALEVIATAADGKIAIEKVRELNPDIVTLDIQMPVMDGLDALTEIRKTHPKLPVVVFSTLSTRGAEVTLDALSRGATDYVSKPTTTSEGPDSFDPVAGTLIPILKELGGAVQPLAPKRSAAAAAPAVRPEMGSQVRAVVLGSSTGGPAALEVVLSSITTPLKVPLMIVQHMPPKFTKSLADRLDRQTASKVVEAESGMQPQPGVVYIAPGGFHMVVEDHGVSVGIGLHEGDLVNSCRPAVDVLFESSASIYGASQLGVILTGMGNDGRNGAEALVKAGADIYAQNEETCVVWGMPKAVVDDGLACKVLPLDEVGQAIVHRTTHHQLINRPVGALS